MIARVIVGLVLLVASVPLTILGLDAGVPGMGVPAAYEPFAILGPLGIGIGIAMVSASKAPPGRFVARVAGHFLVVAGVVTGAVAIFAMGAYYGGPCVSIMLAPVAIALLWAGMTITRATWKGVARPTDRK
ncbi:hypothetical protein [Sandaracinus amylolyticus]|uniref:Transmembrane protein n=1 Tax=Sandaracinus amylolyticus TaxID=927083 RepID=A0A0F6YFS3_9BACT|nr:hypothetical protein [Sandaracinus amylolyticus]AKF03028.1 hypothetical protein DB32_000177 [Sandaracinus amylolyticus]